MYETLESLASAPVYLFKQNIHAATVNTHSENDSKAKDEQDWVRISEKNESDTTGWIENDRLNTNSTRDLPPCLIAHPPHASYICTCIWKNEVPVEETNDWVDFKMHGTRVLYWCRCIWSLSTHHSSLTFG